MKNVIAILEQQLEVLKNNEPINRAEGRIEQADLELQTIAEVQVALDLLGPISA